MKKIVLDNGVFRKLVKSSTSKQEVQGILNLVNGSLPVKLLSTFGLWSEYVGLTRPPLRNPDNFPPFANLTSLDSFNAVLSTEFESLINSYRDDPILSAKHLEQTATVFFEKRVSRHFKDARDLAADIIFFKGQDFNGSDFSWDALNNQLSIDYAVDEVFHLVRHFPPALVDAVGVFTRQITETLKEFKHLPLYRLTDSVVEYIWRVHDQIPDDASTKAKKTIAQARQGIKPLTAEEMGDCDLVPEILMDQLSNK